MTFTQEVVVAGIVQETSDVKTFLFEIPTQYRSEFKYKAGQYVTVEKFMSENKLRGTYYISSSPLEAAFSFTVKYLNCDGMSKHLHDEVRVQDKLIMRAPEGRFTCEVDPEQRLTYYMIGGGSGIIPLYAIIKDILDTEPLSTIHLLYSNRSSEETIFLDQLNKLASHHRGQFQVQFFMTAPRQERFIEFWDGQIGRLNAEKIERYLLDFPKQTLAEKFFICGPKGMNDTLSKQLLKLGRNRDQIYTERFNNAAIQMESKKAESSTKATVHLDGETVEIEVRDQSILQTLIDGGYDPPFSCTSGVCTTCMAKLRSGKVEMEVNYGLDEDEVAEGYILTCQSHPTTDEVELTYDV